jgi:hypothetical protein
MSNKLDVDKVDAALKRAARTAVTGSRAARSGRFLPTKNRGVASRSNKSKHPDCSRRKA